MIELGVNGGVVRFYWYKYYFTGHPKCHCRSYIQPRVKVLSGPEKRAIPTYASCTLIILEFTSHLHSVLADLLVFISGHKIVPLQLQLARSTCDIKL